MVIGIGRLLAFELVASKLQPVCQIAPAAMAWTCSTRRERPGTLYLRYPSIRKGTNVRGNGKVRNASSSLVARVIRPDYFVAGIERRSFIISGPLLRPDVVARLMETDRPAIREVALDLHFVGRDWLIARHAHPTGSGAVPGHAAVLLGEDAREHLLANPTQNVIGLVHCALLQG
jgi:hypothetical protein